MPTPTVRDVLAEQTSGISRAGLLAWCRLRIDPAMTEAQLDDELARLGDDLQEDAGFLRLRPVGPVGPTGWDRSEPGAPAGGESGRAAPEPVDPGRPYEWTPASETTTLAGTDAIAGWQAPEHGMSRARRSATLGALAAAIVAVSVFSVLSGGARPSSGVATPSGGASPASGPSDATAPPAPTGSPVPGATLIAANDIKVGDCLVAPETTFTEVERRPCTTPHDAEVYLIVDLPDAAGASFPADSGFDRIMAERCYPGFQSYTGTAYQDQDTLDAVWFSPSEEGWTAGDRQFICLLTASDGSLISRSWRDGRP